MDKRERNKKLQDAKDLIFAAEVILDEVRKDDKTPEEIKDKLTDILQHETRSAMWRITELFIKDVCMRRKK